MATMNVKNASGGTEAVEKPLAPGRAAASVSRPVVLSNEDFAVIDGLKTALGATNETAPATDTATSGLNGRMQRVAQRLTSLLALQPLAASAPTYMASGTAYGGYATPTDMLVLKGSASKTVRVLQMILYIRSTSATIIDVSFIRRTGANTGGTVSNPTPFAFDTNDPSATAVVDLYSAAPSSLGAGNTLITYAASTGATTGAAPAFQLLQALTAPTFGTAVSLGEALTLRGTSQSLAFNLGGGALPAGFTANWNIVWTEV